MDTLLHSLPNPVEVGAAILVLLAATVYAWKNAVGPLWQWIISFVHKQDNQAKLVKFAENIEENEKWWGVLVPVAKFLEPNGKTLAEHLSENNQAHTQLFAELEEITNKLDTFILERQPNGRRSYDPHE